ncbi:MAG TPA: tRNA (adenosine(37)-N6)-threonylcarbamoyltransferase complex dimerization subunit type 1 TsaB [Candidatus Latescibacteria bacterium]|jgi:tRNA threonylcarbamoyladenosine biosynthesis protein TsaB|nr:tRNA (adenosine(37)-N6)-threonylcarbamoyltransferase complex dimerization subunit type 1 TsaB [Gemmatimonadaceae bacterium]MDP6014779.1 tRNA (adenosine(37)-N6)-threonylcarbamoyltransferase complex dimerization subunit type 1 TsaB [Candidatus Latescibacterota bacterium]HJP29743.1 tRNA (adenosine(37)-N6)-threonylcarbamoyltransferase complex dimerization subunit type 1 TsaB [Candidatus Latescibacterota bacterium]
MLLALDTATPAGSVAVAESGQILALRTFDAPREHSRRLFGEIDEALADAGRERSQVTAVAVTNGPGSFTGLRIGLSAAKGLCMALGVELIPVSTLASLAARIPFCRLPVCALLDARRGEVYGAVYDTSSGVPREVQAPCVDEPGSLLARWGLKDVLFTGDGVDRWAQLLSGKPGANLAPMAARRPCADAVAWLATQRTSRTVVDPARVEPVYLRTPTFAPAGRPKDLP